MYRRIVVQILTLIAANPFWGNFLDGSLYQGRLKGLCVPFLNCYSCPGALASCPLGALQNLLVAPFTRIPFYVVGFLVVVGAIAGRWVCGWMCPFGFIQELPGRLSGIKVSLPRWVTWTKYLVLALTVLLPVIWTGGTGYASPYFCQYFCPQGTLSAGIPLVLGDAASYAPLIGVVFWVKIAILALLLLGSIIIHRPFCRVLCPLGAFFGLFNRISFFRLHYHPERCNNCGNCSATCPAGLSVTRELNSRECLRCLECRKSCRRGALTWNGEHSSYFERKEKSVNLMG